MIRSAMVLSSAQVHQNRASFPVRDDILRLHVAVDEAGGVYRSKAVTDGNPDSHRLVRHEHLLVCDDVGKCAA